MFAMLIDTCVWLDLAKDQRHAPVLWVVEEMVKRGMVTLIVPRVVLDEFRRNRERIANESAKSLSSQIRIVKDAVGRVGGNKRRMRLVLSHLGDVDLKIPIIGGAAVNTLDRIDKLLSGSRIVEASEAIALAQDCDCLRHGAAPLRICEARGHGRINYGPTRTAGSR